MKEIRKFMAEDGTLFDTEIMCRIYEIHKNAAHEALAAITNYCYNQTGENGNSCKGCVFKESMCCKLIECYEDNFSDVWQT